MEKELAIDLLDARTRLARQDLVGAPGATLSLRLPGVDALVFLEGDAQDATRRELRVAQEEGGVVALHARILRARADIGAIASAGGKFSHALANFDVALKPVFDEQVRHLGPFPGRVAETSAETLEAALQCALATGTNAMLWLGMPISFGVNCKRMVFNVELLEKCAKAFLLASATGTRLTTIPWWVRRIAHGRLLRDERRAAAQFALGLVPEDAKAY